MKQGSTQRERNVSNEINPYAPPKAVLEVEPAHEYWREGKILVMRIGSAAPPRCVKCNEPAVKPIKSRVVHWHHPGWYVLVLVNVLLYVLVAFFIRKKARIALGLCQRHLLRRRIFATIGIGGFVFGFFLAAVGVNHDEGGSAVFGALLMLIAAIAGLAASRTAYPSGITKEEVRLKGCGTAFLDSLGDG
jgi:hypothetical protein